VQEAWRKKDYRTRSEVVTAVQLEVRSFLGYDTVSVGQQFPVFRKIVVPSFSAVREFSWLA
jgi:hypothetical protein